MKFALFYFCLVICTSLEKWTLKFLSFFVVIFNYLLTL